MSLNMNTDKLAYAHVMKVSSRVPLGSGSHGPIDGTLFTWSVDNPALATIDNTGRLVRNLSADTGTVVVTFTGWAFDNNPDTPVEQRSNRKVTGSKTFTLVPLADLLPAIPIEVYV
jgi:hypothetical protein